MNNKTNTINSHIMPTLLFLFLAISLAALMFAYWHSVLQPRLLLEAESQAKFLAESQANTVAGFLSYKKQKISLDDINELSDQILVRIDPELNAPFFLGLSLELDPELIGADSALLNFSRGNVQCHACFHISTALYAQNSYEILGIANFFVNNAFYKRLKNDIQKILIIGAAIAFGILLAVWFAVNYLVRQLNIEIQSRKKISKELLSAKEKAEYASQVKNNFLANMSHEIRTPLNAIIGMAYLLLKTPLNKRQHDLLNKLDNSSRLLLNLINDLLDFSKIEAGKLELEETSFSINDVLDNLAALVTTCAADKGLDVLYHTGQDIPEQLIGDPFRLGQILLNLMNNAIKFTDKGSIILTVKKAPQQKNTSAIGLFFTIEDTGIGIAENNIEQLFQSFTQADNSTTRKFGGTGLGLSICKQLIELMDGEISVTSVPGQGSCFSFTVWFSDTTNKATLAYAYPDTSHVFALDDNLADAQYGDFSDKHVLLVEDNITNQEVACALLAELNVQLDIAHNGNQAVAAVQSGSYDLILMDLQMPEMDGFEATRRIRLNPANKETTIIAMTAHAMRGDRQKCLDGQMDDYLIKPVNIKQFYTTIKKWLGSSRKNGTGNVHQGEIDKQAEHGIIDLDKALLRLRGNQDLLLRLLVNFKNTKYDMAEKIATAMADKDSRLAQELVHSLKGESGTLEASALFSASQKLEQALSANNTKQQKVYLSTITRELNTLLEKIRLLENQWQIATPEDNKQLNAALDKDSLQLQCQELAELLRDNNLRAKKLAKIMSVQFAASAYHGQWQELLNSLSELDFDTALKHLSKLVKQCELSLFLQ